MKVRGNSLAEYTVIGGLVLVVSIFAISGFCGHLQEALAGLKSDMEGHARTATVAGVVQMAASRTQAQLAAQQAAQQTAQQTAAGAGVNVQLKATGSLTSSIMVSGANGTSELVLANLEAITKDLLAKGEIDQQTADILVKLANKGHQMAQAEKLLEDAMKNSNGNAQAFNQATVTFNNQSYSTYELAGQLQLVNDANGALVPNSTNSLMSQFQNLSDQATGNIQDSQTQQLVGTLSNQIAVLADGTENATHSVNRGEYAPTLDAFYQDVASSVNGLDPSNGKYPTQLDPASVTTSQDSATICNIGGVQDTGTHCGG